MERPEEFLDHSCIFCTQSHKTGKDVHSLQTMTTRPLAHVYSHVKHFFLLRYSFLVYFLSTSLKSKRILLVNSIFLWVYRSVATLRGMNDSPTCPEKCGKTLCFWNPESISPVLTFCCQLSLLSLSLLSHYMVCFQNVIYFHSFKFMFLALVGSVKPCIQSTKIFQAHLQMMWLYM